MERKAQKVIFRMAVFMGIFLPVAETVRRFNQIPDPDKFLHWFDDYILGAVLLWAAWQLRKGKPNAISIMIAAWGICTGALWLSFMGHFVYIKTNSEDPGRLFSAGFVLCAKAMIFAYMIFGLYKSIIEGGEGR